MSIFNFLKRIEEQEDEFLAINTIRRKIEHIYKEFYYVLNKIEISDNRFGFTMVNDCVDFYINGLNEYKQIIGHYDFRNFCTYKPGIWDYDFDMLLNEIIAKGIYEKIKMEEKQKHIDIKNEEYINTLFNEM